MMLDFLGEVQSASLIRKAVADNLAQGRARTPDLGGSASTGQVGDDLVALLWK